MSMTPQVLAWYKVYYYTGLGLEVVPPEESEFAKTAESDYDRLFVRPICKLFRLNSFEEFATNIKVRNIYKDLQKALPMWPYVLNDLCECGDLVSTSVWDLATKLQEGTVQDIFTVQGNSKDFKVIIRKRDMIGHYPPYKLVRLGSCTRLKTDGHLLNSLANKDPFYLNDFAVEALKQGVENACIEEWALKKTVRPVPENGKIVTKAVNAVYPELPSYSVRNVINHLPDAYLKQGYDNIYVAALNFARETPEYSRCVEELSTICGSQHSTELTDEVVLKYLEDKFGLDIPSLDSLVRPTPQNLYSSAYLLDENAKSMTADEFLESINSGGDAAVGTIDEIIVAYCKEEGISTQCTIAQLIASFSEDETPKPPEKDAKTLVDMLIEAKESTGILRFGEYTVDDLITGRKHEFIDDVDACFDLINGCANISDDIKADIKAALYDEKDISYPDIVTTLSSIKMDDKVLAALTLAHMTGGEFTPPTTEPTSEDLVVALTRNGLPRATAQSLVDTGNIPETAVKGYLSSIGYDDTEVAHIINQDIDLSVTKSSVDDVGYSIANSLLTDMRKAMTANDSDTLRSDLLPIVYSFMRVLMLQNGDKKDAIDFLVNKKSECKPYVAAMIDKAIALYM